MSWLAEAINNPKIIERFWQRVIKGGDDDCWLWTGNTTTKKNGYGRTRVYGKRILSHIFSYAIKNGHPGDLKVLHSCDNRLCVNPKHLFLGTLQDNIIDRDRKGRQAIGSRIGNSKLTELSVLEIKLQLKSGRRQRDIADDFGVSQVCISEIKRGKIWSHIKMEEICG